MITKKLNASYGRHGSVNDDESINERISSNIIYIIIYTIVVNHVQNTINKLMINHIFFQFFQSSKFMQYYSPITESSKIVCNLLRFYIINITLLI